MNNILIEEFSALGCKNRANVIAATLVYLELCELKKYHNVTYGFHKETDIVYINAQKSKSSPPALFLPVPCTNSISFKTLKSYFALSTFDKQIIYVALVNSDSTCVYYQITNGLAEPSREETIKSVETKRENIDNNLKRYKKLIEDSAMCNIPLTIPSLLSGESSSHN